MAIGRGSVGQRLRRLQASDLPRKGLNARNVAQNERSAHEPSRLLPLHFRRSSPERHIKTECDRLNWRLDCAICATLRSFGCWPWMSTACVQRCHG